MSRPRAETAPPQVDPLVLPPLSPGSTDDLGPGADLEALHVPGATLDRLALAGARLWGCHLESLTADDADLTGSRLAETRVDVRRLPVVRAARTDWRDVTVSGRLGSVEAFDARWRSVVVADAKIDYLNLREADLVDVVLRDCVVGELDLTGATLRRVALPGTRVDRVDVRRSELHDVDLRRTVLGDLDGVAHLHGATVSAEQLALLAPLLAADLGIRVED